MPLSIRFCSSLTASKTARVWLKTCYVRKCLVLPHQTTPRPQNAYFRRGFEGLETGPGVDADISGQHDCRPAEVKILLVAKICRIVMSGGFRCGACL